MRCRDSAGGAHAATGGDGAPVASSRATIDALRKAGGRPRHTEYADLGHNMFAWVYTEPALIEWLFMQRRTARADPADGVAPKPVSVGAG